MALEAVWNEETIQKFAAEYRATSSGAMAKKYAVSPQTIRDQLRRLGIELKKPGRPRAYKINGNALPADKEAPQTGTTEG